MDKIENGLKLNLKIRETLFTFQLTIQTVASKACPSKIDNSSASPPSEFMIPGAFRTLLAYGVCSNVQFRIPFMEKSERLGISRGP